MSKKPKTQRLGLPVQIGIVVAGLLVVALGGYMFLVKPTRSEAAKVQTQITAVEKQIADRRSASTARQVKAAVQTADLFRLAKAIPQDENMGTILLELSKVAGDAGVTFDSVTPDGVVAEAGYYALPITLAFDGNFFTLTDFLYRLRQLVQVRDGLLNVTGRLFVVDRVTFAEDEEREFPFVTAEVHLHAFVFGSGAGALGLPPEAVTESTSTETATTETTTTTETTPPAQAAGAAPGDPSN